MDPFDLTLDHRLLILFASAIIGSIVSFIAWEAGFFRVPEKTTDTLQLITWQRVLIAFLIFLAFGAVLVPFLFQLWLSIEQGSLFTDGMATLDIEMQACLNLGGIACTCLSLAIYSKILPKECREAVIGTSHSTSGRWHFIVDLLLGVVTWLVVYPWTIMIGQLVSTFIELGLLLPHVDQLAVKHLRALLDFPFLLALSCIAVVIVVPFLEEFLFRGFLQTWLKKHLGYVRAIIISSVVFSAFHYSDSQGAGNVELLTTLFVLSLFMGYLRERQNSIWASFGLHATFNLISLIMIVFAGF